LKDTDLAIATLSARWPGVVKKMDEADRGMRQKRYNARRRSWCERSPPSRRTTPPSGFANVEIDLLDESWPKLQRACVTPSTSLTAEVGMDNTTLPIGPLWCPSCTTWGAARGAAPQVMNGTLSTGSWRPSSRAETASPLHR
jgi:hypothetical protein